jgi:hypothetical protein
LKSIRKLTDFTKIALLTSEELFSEFRNNQQDQSLLERYGRPMEPGLFENETESAIRFLNNSLNLWEAVAELEYQANGYCVFLMDYASPPQDDSFPVKVRLEYYYEKVVRCIRFMARVEAIANIPFNPYFISSYAADIYPQLVSKIATDARLTDFLDEPIRHRAV